MSASISSSSTSTDSSSGSISGASDSPAQESVIRYLVGDIGGTNSRLELIEVSASLEETTLNAHIYPSQQYPTLSSIIRKFLAEFVKDNVFPRFACFAVAGPVHNNTARITNVNWSLNGADIAAEFNLASVQIINDFVGIGYGLLALSDKDVIPLQDSPIEPDGPKACIGAGTGLGECYLTSKQGEYDVFPSEGGHTDFAARHDIEFRLMQFLKVSQNIPRVSVERCVSGLGIPLIYDFFVSEFPAEVTPIVAEKMKLAPGDKSKIISEYAENRQCPLCVRTIETFVSLYGAEAGNLALKTLCYGGMYIAGGIAPKLKWALTREKKFVTSFLNKGRMASILEKIPIFLVIHPQVGLLGAQVICRREIKRINTFTHLRAEHALATAGKLLLEEEEQQKKSTDKLPLFQENRPINEYTRLVYAGIDEKNAATCHERNETMKKLHGSALEVSGVSAGEKRRRRNLAGREREREKQREMERSWRRWVELGVVAVVGGIVAAAASVAAIHATTATTSKSSTNK